MILKVQVLVFNSEPYLTANVWAELQIFNAMEI